MDTQGALSRSDIVLGSAPTKNTQSMPLGNGTLGVAAWDADGFTAQLNRVDTMPDRKSPGQVEIPGLSALTDAPDYSGRLSLYNATLTQTGGGMSATTFVPAGKDELVVDVHGADPTKPQTVTLHLWNGRTPTISTANGVGVLSETWQDTRGSGATGATFGTLAAVTASGRDVTATRVDSESVELSFTPNADGSFRVIVAAPHWAGGDATATAASALGTDATTPLPDLTGPHLQWWHAFWGHTDVIQMDSADGSAQYIENLRNVALYSAASEERGSIPGTQAGVADLFSYSEDSHQWDPSAYWHWNIRAQTATLLGAGDASLTDPYFDLYRNDLPALQSWTQQHLAGYQGVCVPETMRFSGQGFENETWLSSPGLNCDSSAGGYYNKRTITTGAEIALNVWLRYQLTGDESFLKANYPIMQQAAQFLASYAKVGADGKLHTYPSNAHETQWDVHDPTTDIAAMKALFPVVIAAAQHLNTESGLVATLKTDLGELLPFNTTGTGGNQVIADSYDANAPIENSENIGLEPVWPYGVIGDDSGAATTLAINTYDNRPNKYVNDWSFDAVQAARLGLRDQTKAALVQLTEKYQVFPSGLGNLYGTVGAETYVEQAAAAALGVQEALVQSYDGIVRFAPAVPSDWSVSGSAQVPGGTAHVQTVGGTVSTAVIDADADTVLKIRNPWQGQQVHVLAVANGSSHEVIAPTSAGTFALTMTHGTSYVIERTVSPTTSQVFAPVTGTPATAVKTLGSRTIGISGPGEPLASLAAGFNNVSITDDTHTNGGNIDGGGSASMSLQALAAVGAKSGGTVDHDGLDFAWPASGNLQPDNMISAGQTILVGKAAKRVGFLITGTYAPTGGEITGDAIVHYADGTTQRLTLHAADWSADPLPGTDVALQPAYENRANNTQYDHPAHVYYLSFDLDATKAVTSITLPRVSDATPATVPMLHIFSMAFEDAPATNPGGTGPNPNGNGSAGDGSNPAAPSGTSSALGTGSAAHGQGNGDLASTGSNLLLPVGLGVLLLILGGVGILVIRRHSTRP
ncbi:glycosyl hydrolase family 95 catalytic domain-containing protein [Humibacter antri]